MTPRDDRPGSQRPVPRSFALALAAGNVASAIFASVTALVAHGAAWVALGGLPALPTVSLAREVRVTLSPEPERLPEPEPPPEPELAEPEPPPEPPPVRRERRPDVTPDPTPAVETPPEEPPPMEERIEDFTGTTLSAASTATGPTIIAGNGAPIDGRVGAATGTTTGRSRRGSPDGAPGGSGTTEGDGIPLVAIGDLSRPPDNPPGIRDIVARNYPTELRARGIEGDARISFILYPGGRLGRFRVVSESESGFGDACVQSMRESSGWDTPLDREGNPVSTRITFTCRWSQRL